MEPPVIKSFREQISNANLHYVSRDFPKMGKFTFIQFEGTIFPQYKYMKKKWASAFFENGQMRIGTLHDFSRVDLHGNRRGDQNEGARKYHELEAGACPIVVSTSSVNCYTFCTSSSFSKDIADEFESDCAIEINSIEYFIEISKIMDLKYQIRSSAIGPVVYVENQDVANYTLKLLDLGLSEDEIRFHMPNFALLKDMQFSSQVEVRAIWEPVSLSAEYWPAGLPSVPSERGHVISPYGRRYSPVNKELQAVFPKVPNARQYCRLIEF